ncbi:DODA-type extradiol aromatic ring-opening family dioxygenase [Acinetobacter rathckeae]|uniref:DODA-type extradiol aromatic ring-opening family dioxygenase n=1 Tax=Acinetobacter rathckeae TaxID=2605272 RepID=UPI0018A3198D|nr:class III extradiol ring-cleavage dioxygenase [Acinetobacter rathckeae]MBF7687023.1 dioxygenase [Acinetobacter rathckeae]MBF7694573.1 dioxygenase [Acinetobacter rathckeae]
MPLHTLPGLFISHGSPMLALNPEQVGPALHRLSTNLPKPQAIIVMSAHWESDVLEVSTATRPNTWHDFRGFPELLYQIKYPAPGSLEISERLLSLFAEHQISAHANSSRPRDHGVWMPLLHMYPDADIPVITLSLPTKYTAAQIHRIGEIVSVLRKEQILVIGSGSITHNLRELTWHETDAPTPIWASLFRNYVVQQLQQGHQDGVLDWQNLPYIAQNHPTLEHLAPLFFAMGTGKTFSIVHSSFSMGSLGMDIYRFD